MIRIQVIVGSTRVGRFSEKAAVYVYEELRKKQDVQAELIDLRDWPLPFYDEPVSPAMNKGNYVNPLGKRWAAKVAEGDAYIFVSPEYNHGYSAVLKNAIDWVFHEWKGKPAGFVGYGNAGGARAVEQLRQVVIEVQMLPIRVAIHIPPEVFFPVMKSSTPVDPELFRPLREGLRGDRLEMFFNELIPLAQTLAAARKEGR